MSTVALSIVGSRCLEGNAAAQRAVLQAVEEWRDRCGPRLEIVSGGAEGIDQMAERVASALGVRKMIFLPDAKALKAANATSPSKARYEARWAVFAARNRRIVGRCTHLLRIYCPGSEGWGSGWTEREALRAGRVIVPSIEITCVRHAGKG
jgi:hypothetical protein